jgi:branched-chain amino acid transport system substrate-binding protein
MKLAARHRPLAGIVASLLALAAACGGEAAQPGAAPAKPAPSARASAAGGGYPAWIRLGVSLPFSGFDAADGGQIRNGVVLGIDQINAAGGIAGKVRIEHWIRDEGRIDTDGDDPGRAAANMAQYLPDSGLLAVVGGYSSDAAKSMLDAEIKSADPLVIVSPSATASEITEPAHAAEFRPKGKPYFFRTVTTDAYQGPGMANFAAAKGIKSVYVLNERGSISGRSAADQFAKQAQAKGIKVVGRTDMDPALLDYGAILGDIEVQNPQGVYYDGSPGPWLKLIKQGIHTQAPPLMMAGDGIYAPTTPAVAGGSGEGWYVSVATRYGLDQPRTANWTAEFNAAFHGEPTSAYALTGYMAVKALADAIGRIVADGAPLRRDNVQAYLLQTKLATIQGPIVFDPNGDLTDHTVSLVQIKGGRFHYADLTPAS